MSGRKGEFMPIYTDKKTKQLYIQFDFLGQTYKKRLPKKTTKGEAGKLETKLKNKLFFENNGIEANVRLSSRIFSSNIFCRSPKQATRRHRSTGRLISANWHFPFLRVRT